MKRILSILFLFIGYDTIAQTNREQPTLVGNWEWIKRTGGIAGGTFYPENSTENWKLTISSDSIFKQYLNDSLLRSSSFSLKEHNILYYENKNFIPDQVFFEGEDTVTFRGYRIVDGGSITYKRRK